MQNHSSSSILCVGDDPELLRTRAEVLRGAGAVVEGLPSRNALSALRQERFDVVVVCHSVKGTDAERIYEAAHAGYAQTVVVRVMPFWIGDPANSRNSFDAVVLAEPAMQARMVRALLQRRAASAA